MGDKGLLGPGVRGGASEAGSCWGGWAGGQRRSRGPAGARVCAGAGPASALRARPPARAPPSPPTATHRPRGRRAGTHANKDASIYSPLPGRFLRHSAGTIIKLICI